MSGAAPGSSENNSDFPHFNFDQLAYKKYLNERAQNKYAYSDIITYIEKKIWPSYCVTLELKEEFCDEIKNFYVKDGKLGYRNIGPDLEFVSVAVVCDPSTQFEIMKQFHCAFHVPNQPHQPVTELHNILVTKYYWFNMVDDIKNFIACCRVCSSGSPALQTQETPNKMKSNQDLKSLNEPSSNPARNNDSSKNIRTPHQSISPSFTQMNFNSGILPNANNNNNNRPMRPRNDYPTTTLVDKSNGVGYVNKSYASSTNIPFMSNYARYNINDNRNQPVIPSGYAEPFPFVRTQMTTTSHPVVPSMNCYPNRFPISPATLVGSYPVKIPKSTFPAFSYQSASFGTMMRPPCSSVPPTQHAPTSQSASSSQHPTKNLNPEKSSLSSVKKSVNITSSAATVKSQPSNRPDSYKMLPASSRSELPNLSPSSNPHVVNPPLPYEIDVKACIDQIKVDAKIFKSTFNEMVQIVNDMEGDMIGAMTGSQSSYSKINNSMKQLLNVQMPPCLKFLIETIEINKSNSVSQSTKNYSTDKNKEVESVKDS